MFPLRAKSELCADLKKWTAHYWGAPRTQQEVTDRLQLLSHHLISCIWRESHLTWWTLSLPSGTRRSCGTETFRCSGSLSLLSALSSSFTLDPNHVWLHRINISGATAPAATQRHRGRGWMRHSHCAHFHRSSFWRLRGHLLWKLHGSSPASQ